MLFFLNFRFRIRGVKHLYFYELPSYPHYYTELCNACEKTPQESDENFTSTAMYSKLDGQKLAEIVGTKQAEQLINAEKSVHLFAAEKS
jgi:U3 small nucleolar RNA-associated protein 25